MLVPPTPSRATDSARPDHGAYNISYWDLTSICNQSLDAVTAKIYQKLQMLFSFNGLWILFFLDIFGFFSPLGYPSPMYGRSAFNDVLPSHASFYSLAPSLWFAASAPAHVLLQESSNKLPSQPSAPASRSSLDQWCARGMLPSYSLIFKLSIDSIWPFDHSGLTCTPFILCTAAFSPEVI